MQPKGHFERQAAVVLLAMALWTVPRLVPQVGAAMQAASQPVQTIYAVLAIGLGVIAVLIVIYWAAIYLSTGR